MAKEFCFRVRPARNGVAGFVAFARRGDFTLDQEIQEAGDLWFAFGIMADDALLQVKAEAIGLVN